jgi:hypothetical protein
MWHVSLRRNGSEHCVPSIGVGAPCRRASGEPEKQEVSHRTSSTQTRFLLTVTDVLVQRDALKIE